MSDEKPILEKLTVAEFIDIVRIGISLDRLILGMDEPSRGTEEK